MTVERDELEEFLASARNAETPSDDLMARVLSDAANEQAAIGRGTAASETRRSGFGLRGILSAIGGWPSASGLAAAAVTGLLIGVYAPNSLDDVLGGQLSNLGLVSDTTLIPGIDDLLSAEGG